ncbi:alpha-amylase family protein [Xylanimonas protaetiae]|uniref:Alpha-amylase n=1 Tax=Xylanimonas protaetiae TaxID=2509457 RepID=A0A4P6EZ61_9MICO|nr:alpha-amylase family protein [Xylanimonas protaetiae]QAY68740.1 alpha-amylase [Xylanimonas protaetiae]
MARDEQPVWWHVYPLGFCDAPIRDADPAPATRLRRLLGWLDYAADLGVTGLLLGPVFASQSHGYDSLDLLRIDPRLGGDQDFDDLVAACGERGLRIVLDGVFSHVGDRHPWLVDALAHGPDSEHAGLFDIVWDADGGPAPRVWEGHGALARLDHASAQTADHVVDVMEHWLARGTDGWRLDAAYSVDTAFWARVIPRVRARFPHAWFLGEVIHGDYAAFVEASGVDTVTQYELWKAVRSSIADRNFFELDWTLRRHNELLGHFTPQTFVGNHDVTRVASAVGADHAVTAAAILLTVGGVPSVYAGDEQGFTGVKEDRLGGDDAVRPAFPDRPEDLAPWGSSVHRAHRELLALRHRHPWLTTATTTTTHLSSTRYAYRTTSRDAQDWLDVEHDLDAGTFVSDRAGRIVWRHAA